MRFERHKETSGKASYIFGIIGISVIVGLYGVIYAIDRVLPTPLKLEDEIDHPEDFIAERAKNYLEELIKIGPRVVGHPNNEILAVEYLTKTIEDIIENKHVNQKITYDITETSGAFFLDFKPNGAINVYENIQNIVVKIHSKTDSQHSVLINTHFDTVPNSPGGSDDGINVAIALEIMNKLSKLEERPTHNIIFLFNGAEEAALCGSHAFITQHYLAKEVRVFINLEASGAGGKEILFQTGPDEPWLLKYYDVPHPHANAGAEEIFQYNIIPSDTDFRIFRDFGEIIGYDFAYYKDGYRYHTKYDLADNIDLGSFQHTGDNILRLVKNLLEAPELENPKTEDGGKTVFFDIFGVLFFNYTMETNVIFNTLLSILSICLVIWACVNVKLGGLRVSVIYITISIFVILLGWFLASGIILILAVLMDVTKRPMSWYSSTALIFPLYVAPIVGCMLITSVISNKVIRHKTLTQTGKVLMQVHIIRLTWTLPFIVTTILGLRIGIFFMFGILFNTIGMLIVHLIDICKPKLTPKIFPLIFILSTIIPTMIIYFYAHLDIAMFTPIFGRFGPGLNPDMLMSLFVTSFTMAIGSYYVPLFTYMKKPWYIIMVLAGFFIAGIILAYTPVGFPYSFSETNPKVQRYSIFHTMSKYKDSNEIEMRQTGYYLNKNDRNTPHSIEGEVSFMDNSRPILDECELAPGCGLPIMSSRNIKNLDDGVWIITEKPPFPWSSEIEYTVHSILMVSHRKRFSVEIEGSDKIDVYLSIRKGFKLIQLSLLDEIPKSIDWNGQETYYLSFVYGKTPKSFSFHFVVESETTFSSPCVDLSITTKYVHNDLMTKTNEYENLLKEFPKWSVVTVSGLAQSESIVLS